MDLASGRLWACGIVVVALAGGGDIAQAGPRITGPVDPWRVVSTTKANELTATIKFANGHVFAPHLYHPVVIGVLPSGVATPYLVVDGVECTECDATARSVYVGDPAAWPKDFSKHGWAVGYPSRDYSATTGKLMSRSRLFIGRCMSERPGVVSFYAAREETGWSRRVDWVEVSGGRLAPQAAKAGDRGAPTIHAVVKSVRAGRCREVRAQTTNEGDYG